MVIVLKVAGYVYGAYIIKLMVESIEKIRKQS